MKFIIDENISPAVAKLFRNRGLKAYHINEMKSRNDQQVLDDQIRHLALFKDYIVVTRDHDFVRSFRSRKVPEKVIFIHKLENRNELLERLSNCLKEVVKHIDNHDFIEINSTQVRMPFD
ncbi:MAG: DUF5615 family PIN-like protein [Bacteroidota bacterium]